MLNNFIQFKYDRIMFQYHILNRLINSRIQSFLNDRSQCIYIGEIFGVVNSGVDVYDLFNSEIYNVKLRFRNQFFNIDHIYIESVECLYREFETATQLRLIKNSDSLLTTISLEIYKPINHLMIL